MFTRHGLQSIMHGQTPVLNAANFKCLKLRCTYMHRSITMQNIGIGYERVNYGKASFFVIKCNKDSEIIGSWDSYSAVHT